MPSSKWQVNVIDVVVDSPCASSATYTSDEMVAYVAGRLDAAGIRYKKIDVREIIYDD